MSTQSTKLCLKSAEKCLHTVLSGVYTESQSVEVSTLITKQNIYPEYYGAYIEYQMEHLHGVLRGVHIDYQADYPHRVLSGIYKVWSVIYRAPCREPEPQISRCSEASWSQLFLATSPLYVLCPVTQVLSKSHEQA